MTAEPEDAEAETAADQGDDRINVLVAAVMKIERRYAHALRGVESDRLEGVRSAIDDVMGADE